MLKIVPGENLEALRAVASGGIDLIYIDPPFNTGRTQERASIRTEQGAKGDRVGFQGRRYRTTALGATGYADRFDDYPAFLEPRLQEARRALSGAGSLFFHIDYREVHYCKALLDGIFGRESFINEIIWAYDYGGRSKSRRPAKHDNIPWHAKDPGRYAFHYDAVDRIPCMAPGLVGAEKTARGKTPTDAWRHTIAPTNSKEKTGYATQKPLGLLERIVKAHSSPGDALLDFFAGSGAFGETAARHGRDCILVDNNPEAVRVMTRRLERFNPKAGGTNFREAESSELQSMERVETREVEEIGTKLDTPASHPIQTSFGGNFGELYTLIRKQDDEWSWQSETGSDNDRHDGTAGQVENRAPGRQAA